MLSMSEVLKQSDRPWGPLLLGNGTGTIAAYGCALTSCCMLFNALQRVNDYRPDRMNEIMRRAGINTIGESRNLMDWPRVPEVFPLIHFAGRIRAYGRNLTPQEWAAIRDRLRNGLPLIFEVRFDWKLRRPIKQHFVLAVAELEGDLMIADPVFGDIEPITKRYGPTENYATWGAILYDLN